MDHENPRPALHTGDPVIIRKGLLKGCYGRINTRSSGIYEYSVFISKFQGKPVELHWYDIEPVSEEEYLASEVVYA